MDMSLLAQVLKGARPGDKPPRRSSGRSSDGAPSSNSAPTLLGSANAERLEWLVAQMDSLESRVEPHCAATERFVPPGLTPQQAVKAIHQNCSRVQLPLPADTELLDMAFDFSLAGSSGVLDERTYGDLLLIVYRHSLATLAEELARDWIARLNAEEPNAPTLEELHRLLHGGSGSRSARRSHTVGMTNMNSTPPTA